MPFLRRRRPIIVLASNAIPVRLLLVFEKLKSGNILYRSVPPESSGLSAVRDNDMGEACSSQVGQSRPVV